jgi:hypothetical protein
MLSLLTSLKQQLGANFVCNVFFHWLVPYPMVVILHLYLDLMEYEINNNTNNNNKRKRASVFKV